MFKFLISLLFYLNSKIIAKSKIGRLNLAYFANVFWFIYISVPSVLNFKALLNPAALIYIYLSILTFSIGSILFHPDLIGPKDNPSKPFENKKLKRILAVLASLSIISQILHLTTQGVELISILINPFEFANRILGLRYRGEIITSLWGSIGTLSMYSSSILSGLLIPLTSNKSRWIVFWGIIPSIVLLLTTAAKGQILLSLFYMLGGIISSKIYLRQSLTINKSIRSKLIPVILSISVLIIVAFISRNPKGYENSSIDEIGSVLYKNINSYASGHIIAFSDWFSSEYFEDSKLYYSSNKYEFYPGFFTFSPVLKMLGYSKNFEHGVYTEFYEDQNIKSNIYTVFRGLIYDFGFFGNFIFWLILGLFSQVIYNMIYFKKNIMALCLFPLLLGWIYQTYIISNFMWSTTILSGITVFLLIQMTKLKI